MNFSDLSRFMDDFFYLLQKGGKDKALLSTGGKEGTVQKVIRYVVLFLKLLVIIVVIYILYILIFRGYPRLLMDLGTLSLFHKEKPDDFIKEGNLLLKHFKFLAQPPNKCVSPYTIYKQVYNNDIVSNLQMSIQKFENIKNQYYEKFNYDDKYHNAFKDFYLFFNVCNDATVEVVVNKGKSLPIESHRFYELLATYKISLGELDPKDSNGVEKSPDALVQEIYLKEKTAKIKIIDGIKNIHSILLEIGTQTNTIIELFNKTPITPFILIPSDDKIINKIISNINQYNGHILNNTIYNVEYAKPDMDDYSWCMIEYIMSLYDQNQYDTFASSIPSYKNDDIDRLIYYINLSRDKKIPTGNNAKQLETLKKYMNTRNDPIAENFFEFINKRPIFAHIYFTQQDLGNKKEFYNTVMLCYRLLCDCNVNASLNIDTASIRSRLDNLKVNGYAFKQFIIAVGYIHLFLNVYQQNLTRMYSKHIISAGRFFKELYNPVVNDIIVNRIGNYFKLTFSSQGMGSSYKKFHKWYKQLGKDLDRMIKAVFKSFFTGVPIKPPEPEDT